MLPRLSLQTRLLLSELCGLKISQQVCQRAAPRVVVSAPLGASFRSTSSDVRTRGDIGRRTFPNEEEAKSLEDSVDQDSDLMLDREFIDMTVDHFEKIHKGDERIIQRIELILVEYEHMKYDSIGRVPSVINQNDMEILLEEGTNVNNRRKLFHFFFKREMHKRSSERRRKREKEETRLRLEARRRDLDLGDSNRSGLLSSNGDLMYGLWHNSLFARVPERNIKVGLSNSRLRNAALFGRKLIFDFGFEDYMTNHSRRNSLDQIQEAYGMNRFDYMEPFDLWFCNYSEDSFSGQYCKTRVLKNLYTDSMITIKPDCMTKYFDKSRLVYLSPNAKEPLGQIGKSDDIYIVGVFNDKGNTQPVSIRKATKLGIRAKKLPLDTHLLWQGPSKALCINHVVGVLLEVLSNGGDWYGAFTKHIPARKIKKPEQVLEEERIRQERLKVRKLKDKFSLRLDFD